MWTSRRSVFGTPIRSTLTPAASAAQKQIPISSNYWVKAEHGAKTLRVPWAGKGSRFTLLFESFAIEVSQACSSVKAAAELMRLNWHQVNEIKRQARPQTLILHKILR